MISFPRSKALFCAFFCLSTFCIQGQENDYESVQKGFLAFGINSTNLFELGADVFSSENSGFELFNFEEPDSLVRLKYFFEDNKCVRIGLGMSFRSDKTDEVVQAFDDNLLPIEGQVVRNIFIDESLRLNMRIGLEKNRSYKKWRYFHGAELGFSLTTGRNRIINGNPLPLYIGATLDNKLGSTFSLGSNVLGGFEYMFVKNASVGIEINWGLTFSNTSPGQEIIVSQNSSGQAVELIVEGEAAKNQFQLENMPGARIFALVYLASKNK